MDTRQILGGLIFMSAQRFVAAVIGIHSDPRRHKLIKALRDRTRSMRELDQRLEIVDQSRIKSLPADAHVVAVVLCRKGMPKLGAEVNAIAEARQRGIPIIPVVADLRNFTAVAPDGVKDFNGFELNHLDDIGELVGLCARIAWAAALETEDFH